MQESMYLEDNLALLSQQLALLLMCQVGPEVPELCGLLLGPEQACTLVITEASAHTLHIGQVNPDQLPSVLWIQAPEWFAGLVPAIKQARLTDCTDVTIFWNTKISTYKMTWT